MAKDNRPILNPSACVQSLERYMEAQTMILNTIPMAIDVLKNIDTPQAKFIAEKLTQQYEALNKFHENFPK